MKLFDKLKNKITNKKVIAGVISGFIGITTIVALAVTLPLTEKDYNSETSKHSWNESEYGPDDSGWPQDPKYIPTGLGVNATEINPNMDNADSYALGALRYLEKRPGYPTPDKFKKFAGQYIYCVANHVPNYTLTKGMQAFEMNRYQPSVPFSDCAGTGDTKTFNFLMLAIACDYGTDAGDYRPEDPNNAYYGITSQAIAWVTTASPEDQEACGVIKGDNLQEDLETFRKYPIYRAVMDNSFPEDTHPAIYKRLHAPSTGWHAAAGCRNWFESVFADVWNAAKLTQPLNIDWEAEKSTLTGQSEKGEDGFYHMYLNVFQSDAMKNYLSGIHFDPDGSDWTLVEQTADGTMHFKSPTGTIPESGSIGRLYWPTGTIGGLVPKDLSSAKLYTFTFYSPGSDGVYGFGKTQTHFGSVIDKDLSVYITAGGNGESGGSSVSRYKHTEEFTADYTVNLKKLDSETGKPLEGSHFDILESFDDSQLDGTVLEDDNWANQSGSQFETWDDPNQDPCDRDDNVTDDNGELCELNSDGSASSTKAHTDVKHYLYEKGYSGEHPVPEFVDIPEPEYEESEDGEESDEPSNQNEIDEAKAKNDALLQTYLDEIKLDKQLKQEGGYFYSEEEDSIDLDASGGYETKEEYQQVCNQNRTIPDAKAQLEADRDQHYKDFISLTYDYSAKEIKASKGYILHGLHSDDIPIETRTVTSSQYKATDMAENLDHTQDGFAKQPDRVQRETVKQPDRLHQTEPENGMEPTVYQSNHKPKAKSAARKQTASATQSNADDFLFVDEEQKENRQKTGFPKASVSDADDKATPSNAAKIVSTGYVKQEKSAVFNVRSNGALRDSVPFKNSTASTVTPPDSTIVDWTFIIYDHRTEGEIHINKQDFNLSENQTEHYSSYAQSNGDGTLEGAVYGLFAAADINHPDGHTGIVFHKDDLVSVATTDRNGDASFMAITEAPGYTFDYKSGKPEATDWAEKAPKNLYVNKTASSNEPDIESFVGHNPDGSPIIAGNGNDLKDTGSGSGSSFEKFSSNQGYEDTSSAKTTGSYPISDNEDNNGNCWIGRPLIISKDGTQYYIKELSRSEGYELSVYGKDDSLMTNRDAFLNGGSDFASGSVSVSGMELDRTGGGNTFTVTSANTTDGYDLVTTNIPQNASFFITTTDWIWDDQMSHKESVETQEPVMAEEGSLVMADGHTWKANSGDTVTLSNGTHYQVNQVNTVDNSERVVKPANRQVIENPNLSPEEDENYIEAVRKAFAKNKFRVPSDEAPWVLVPFEKLDAQSIADAINQTIFTDPFYDVFNAMTLVGTTSVHNQKYAVVTYDYMSADPINALYNKSNDSIYVKLPAIFQSDLKAYQGWIWKACDNYRDPVKNEAGFITSAYVPNEIVKNESFKWHKDDLADKAVYQTKENESYWAYAEGEQLIGTDGNPVTKTVVTEVDVKPTLVPKITDTKLADVSYENGQYHIHIPQSIAAKAPSTAFRIKYAGDSVTVDNVEYPTDLYVYDHGLVNAMLPITHADSFIESVFLSYPGQTAISADEGTDKTPVSVLERPIRQQIKVKKDILTNPDGSEIGDTYSTVHKDNLSPDQYNRWQIKTEDPASSKETKMGDFRFKAYLKSNLERLYRDENGTIVFLDRNGNLLTPNYQDTDHDGNYDTFTWTKTPQDTGAETTVDFPEEQLTKDGVLESTNVQKIYTKVEHNPSSEATGDNANNTWAAYNDPQTGAMLNTGSKNSYSTSLNEKQGEAVYTSDSLYSYNGKNLNTKKTDRLNEDQNTGYTRLLETTANIDESGTTYSYNYKKFFDAIHAANTDKWDNDMFSSDKNYPGQNWFETFYEKYQKDDADPDHTIQNTDGADADGTAGGDRDTSFKPFSWIREQTFKENGQEQDYYQGTPNNPNIENEANTSALAKENAEASDAVRQFAIDYYLQDEAAKLVQNNGHDEDEAIPIKRMTGTGETKYTPPTYSDEIYDMALHNALIKAVNYLKPFYDNDLDTIYSVSWDSEKNGGSDHDDTTLSVTKTDPDKDYYYGISAYLPYGTYVIVEQQPERIDDSVNDLKNKRYQTDLPKEVTLPSLYHLNQPNDTMDDFDPNYVYLASKTPEDLTSAYHIRFNEEWADNHTDDLRNYVIRAHNHDGDYEVYPYGLSADRLTSTIHYGGGSYPYKGFSITQKEFSPLKSVYSPIHRVNETPITNEDGASEHSHYFADDKNGSTETANGTYYTKDAIEERYYYGSISERQGSQNGLPTITGSQTAYEGTYAPMLVPWSVVTPVDTDDYHSNEFTGFADTVFHNPLYKINLRIEKLDSETGENILHDGAIFGLYAASRYTTQQEVDQAVKEGAPDTTKIGNVKCYLKDTTITGSYEFLTAMGADNIRPYKKLFGKNTNLYSGTVSYGTPVCVENEQIVLYDESGAKTGSMAVYTTTNDVSLRSEEDETAAYHDQNTGYFITPQPVSAGVYVLAELKPPSGYVRTKPIAIEIGSDAVAYYMNGDIHARVEAAVYK